MLPEESVWIDINYPLEHVLASYESFAGSEDIVVFASEDPIYYGFTTSIMQHLPDVKLKMFPTFSSLHRLADHLMIPHHDMYVIDFENHGWHSFDFALIKGKGKIGLNTDHVHTVQSIAYRMMEYGYSNYSLYVGENMNSKSRRVVRKMKLVSAVSGHFDYPNCVILVKDYENPSQPFGLPDHFFTRVRGQELKITPLPVRLFSLSLLDLKNRSQFWDIGFCTGSVAIDAKLQFPHLHVTAFEVDEECGKLINTNSRRCGTPGIHTILRDFCKADLELLERPDAVFIGGHGGKLLEIVSRVVERIDAGGIIVFSSRDVDSNALFLEAAQMNEIQVLEQTRFTIDNYQTCTVFKALCM